jgi:alpha-galactosidase
MQRKQFIKTIGISLGAGLLTNPFSLLAEEAQEMVWDDPGQVLALVNEQWMPLKRMGSHWEAGNIKVQLKKKKASTVVEVEAPGVLLSEVRLQWSVTPKTHTLVFRDQWERTYGDSGWQRIKDEALFPWFFMEQNADDTYGFGVKTGSAAFCGWLLSEGKMTLQIDTRNGSGGVALQGRKLKAAEIVAIKNRTGENPFSVARRFAKLMCGRPRLAEQAVYGINDWYFTYGKNSADLILQHTRLIAPMAAGLSNRPFSVIDDGWFVVTDKGKSADVITSNEKFGDMHRLAQQINAEGMRPGLWTRPLLATTSASDKVLLRPADERIYDPSIPENLERVATLFKTYKAWNYEMIKFDYTSWDIFQKWGFQMLADGQMSGIPDWHFKDQSKTNAEIILNLYRTIREASGAMYVMGCNTFSHLSAGLFEVNRIGDDTSGNEWARTRKMGVNTLAARGFTHNLFYAADPDCVGLTTKIDWSRNRQWMELVAKSGTPLFISAQPEAVGSSQKQTIKECLEFASRQLPVGEPVDWMENLTPSTWKLNGKVETFDWSGS